MADYVSGAFGSWVSQWAEASRFNPNHGAAGSGKGGQFTSGGSGGSGKAAAKGAPKAPAAKKAKRLPSSQPNGYSAAQWRRLQKLEADHAAGKTLTAHELHELHVAHEKHEAYLAAQEAAARKNAARRPAGHLPAPKAAAPAAGKGAPRKAPANNTNKYFAGHPVKGA